MRFSSLSTEADEIKTISPFNLAVKIVTTVFHVGRQWQREREAKESKAREKALKRSQRGEPESIGNE